MSDSVNYDEVVRERADKTGALQAAFVQLAQGWAVPVVLFISVLALNLFSLLRIPYAFVDEAWNANRAWALINTGRAFGTLDSGVFERYNGYWTFFPWLGTWIHSLFIRAFGPDLFSMRLASLVFGMVLLAAVFAIGVRLYGKSMGLISVTLVAFSPFFIASSHLGRHDIIVAALGFVGIALYLTDDTDGFSLKALVCGLLISLNLDIHLNAVIYGPAMVALYLLDYRWKIFHSRRFWSFVVGGSAGVAFFLVMHILPYPQTYFALFSLGNGSGRTPSLLTADPAAWLASIGSSLDLLGIMVVLLLAAAFGLLIWRRSAADKRMLVIVGVLFLEFTFVIKGKPLFYGIVFSPAAALAIAAFLVFMLNWHWKTSLLKSASRAFAWSFVALMLAANLLPMIEINSADDYQQTIAFVKQVLPPNASVIGPQTYWFAVPDSHYLSWEQLVYYRRYAQGSTLEDAFHALHADYFILDKELEGAIVDNTTDTTQRLPFLYLPKAELAAFLSKQAHLVSSVETGTFGNVRIYKID